MNEIQHYGVLGMRWGIRKERYPGERKNTRYLRKQTKRLSEMTAKEHNAYKKNLKRIMDTERDLLDREKRSDQFNEIQERRAERLLKLSQTGLGVASVAKTLAKNEAAGKGADLGDLFSNIEAAFKISKDGVGVRLGSKKDKKDKKD